MIYVFQLKNHRSKPILTIKGKTFSSASPPRFHKSLWSTPSCLAIAGLHHDVFLLNIEKIIELNQEKCGLERGYIVNELELDTGLEGLEGVKKVSVDGVRKSFKTKKLSN